MQNSDKKASYPKILIAVFVAILAIIGFGVGQSIYSPHIDSPGNVFGNTDELTNVNIAPIPIIKNSDYAPLIYANNYVLIDADSKIVLTSRGARDRVAIASITKVMTAIVVLENTNIEKEVVIVPSDIDVTGSKLGLLNNEKITIEDLLRGLMIKSGNDCANTLGRATFGNSKLFVDKMNQKAKGIGLLDTKYMDPHGLSQDAYSTAYDQAILFSYAIKNSGFKRLISTPEVSISSVDKKYTHQIVNSNRLITDELHFDGIIGGKTGFTYEAGHSLTAAAQRDGHTLISVVLKTKSSANEASAQETSKLLSWGFDNFNWQ